MLNKKSYNYALYNDNWSKYTERTIGRENAPSFLKQLVALQQIKNVPKHAADIGCGAGNELVYLIENGYQVLGVDANEDAVLQAKLKCQPYDSWQVIQHDLNHPFDLPMQDLIYSYAVLFFLPKNSIYTVITNLCKHLNANGLLGFNLIGPNDDWANNMIDMPVSIYAQEEINDLIQDTNLSLIDMVEIEHDGPLASGEQKHWHEFRIILQN